jgi:acyl-CoA synthetase (AMP-forming)/AMP-acid ligase II
MPDHIVEDIFYNKVRAIARRNPEHHALDCNGQVITYGELIKYADQCALALAELGVGYGDRVAFMSPPRPEVIIVLLACSWLGATFAGLGLRLGGEDLRHVLVDSESRVIFAPDCFEGRACADEIEALLPRKSNRKVLRLSISDDNGIAPEFEAFVNSAKPAEVQGLGRPLTPLAVIYTSGSTGKPKGVEVTNLGLLTSVTNGLARIDMGEVRALSLLPVDHVGFLANEVAMPLLAGGTAVQISRFHIPVVLDAIAKKRITLWCAIPTMLQRLATSPLVDDYDLTSLEYVWWPGPLSEDAFRFIQKKAKRLGVSYGMTETAGGITFSDRDTPQERLLYTVGRPLPCLKVKLDAPALMDGREVGEILVRGPQVVREYWNRPDATAAAFTEDGWFRTGDLGAFEGEYLSIVGRKKELIRSGGYNISPYEVEAVLETHPAVHFAVVVGVADDEYGEVVVAAVSFMEGQSAEIGEILGHVKAELPGYKVPKQISAELDIPFLANGKVDRKGLQEKMCRAWKENSKQGEKV